MAWDQKHRGVLLTSPAIKQRNDYTSAITITTQHSITSPPVSVSRLIHISHLIGRLEELFPRQVTASSTGEENLKHNYRRKPRT